VDARGKEVAGDLIVQGRRHDDADGVDPADEVPVVGDGLTAVPVGERLGPRGIAVGYRDQVGIGETGVDAGMVPAPLAESDDTDPGCAPPPTNLAAMTELGRIQ
jgi:hypothetical protein